MTDKNGNELTEAVINSKEMPNLEALEKLYEQGQNLYISIYEFFCDFIYKQKTGISKMTEAEFVTVVFEFMSTLPEVLNSQYPELYETFIKPFIKDKEDFGMILTYIGNLYLQPLVCKVAREFIEKRGINFNKPNNGFREVIN